MAAAERVETNMLDCTNVVLLFLVFLTHKWLNFLGLLSMCNQGCWSQTALAHMGTLCVYTYIYIGMFCTYIHILVSRTREKLYSDICLGIFHIFGKKMEKIKAAKVNSS